MSIICLFNRGATTSGTFRPSTYASTVATLTNPANAIDANLGTHGDLACSAPNGTGVWTFSGFPSGTVTGFLKISSYATEFDSDGAHLGSEQMEYSLNGGSTWTTVYLVTNAVDRGTLIAPTLDAIALTAQDMTLVQVRATSTNVKLVMNFGQGFIDIFDIRIEG